MTGCLIITIVVQHKEEAREVLRDIFGVNKPNIEEVPCARAEFSPLKTGEKLRQVYLEALSQKVKHIAKVRKYAVLVSICVIVVFLVCKAIVMDIPRGLILLAYSKVSGKRKGIAVRLDDSGVPIVDYGRVEGEYVGKQRNPVTVCLKAFDYWDEYQGGDEGSRQPFLNCANWLVENATSYGDFSLWEYNFPFPKYAMTPPWRSAMAQGLGIQVLIRAYELTGDNRYFDVGEKCLRSFFVEVKDGGVTYKTSTSAWWYEEYADEQGKRPRVLNGMIYAVMGLHEYYQRTGAEEAKLLFDQGVLAVKNNLPDYDSGDWSYYDALGNLATESYHRLHVRQLSLLYDFTKEPIFETYHDKWESYRRPLFMARLFPDPTKMDIVVFGTNLVVSVRLFEIAICAIERRRKAK